MDVYVTPGDLRRIAAYTGRDRFTEFRVAADPEYARQDDDPTWRDRVLRPDNSRRVLERRPDGECTFLSASGCALPLDVRPLVCRLYPYEYTESGILEELVRGCPLELLRPDQGLIDALGMSLDDARRWHEQLYAEVRLEELEHEPI
jgi:Fe-S-cluster containining protein